jgi:hypothetical protein
LLNYPRDFFTFKYGNYLHRDGATTPGRIDEEHTFQMIFMRETLPHIRAQAAGNQFARMMQSEEWGMFSSGAGKPESPLDSGLRLMLLWTCYDCAALSAARTRSGRKGARLIRTPVASNIALPIAAIIGL